jgi:hypothetical protein
MTNILFCDLFVNRLNLMDDDSEDDVRLKFERAFIDALGSTPDAFTEAHILGYYLGYLSDRSAAQPYFHDPKLLQARALQSLELYFHGMAQQTALVIILEDIHWSDPGSLRLLQQLFRRLSADPILVIITTRETLPEVFEPVEPDARVHRLMLMPLNADDCTLLSRNLLAGEGNLSPELHQFILERSEGNPLFIEELIHLLHEQKALRHSADGWHLDQQRLAHQLPTTLISILQTRLADLTADELLILQIASVIGRIFWDTSIITVLTMVNPTADNPERRVQQSLSELERRMLILRPRHSVYREHRQYVFYHALLRDAVYITILKRDRRRYHAGAAKWMLDALKKGTFANDYTAILASHYEGADQIDDVDYSILHDKVTAICPEEATVTLSLTLGWAAMTASSARSSASSRSSMDRWARTIPSARASTAPSPAKARRVRSTRSAAFRPSPPITARSGI